ncbi:hypothetical protein IAU59_006640 [Kwoniella sp. CBS 9459]
MAIVEDLGPEDNASFKTASNNPFGTNGKNNKAKAKAKAKASSKASSSDTLRNRHSNAKIEDENKNSTSTFSATTHPDIPLAHPSVARGGQTSQANVGTTPLVSLSDLGLGFDPNAVNGEDDNDDDDEGRTPFSASAIGSDPRIFTLKPGEELPEHLLHPRSGGGAGVGVGASPAEEEEVDEVFNALILAVPFSFLYLLLDILVHLQYSHRPSWGVLVKHLATAIPTNRHPTHFATNPLLMAASLGSGCRLMWLVNKASWSVVTEQAPAMGTLWILTIVQLPLSRAMIALFGVGAWLWYAGLKLVP